VGKYESVFPAFLEEKKMIIMYVILKEKINEN